jgi:ABC-type spermidine/putrescine transport system permease subunit II
LGVSPEINVLATITITVVAVTIVAVNWFMARRARLESAG